jgi:uncharacterized protein
MIHISLRIVRFLIIAAILLVATQDIQVFPYALLSLVHKPSINLNALQPVPESAMIATADNERLEVWRVAAALGQPALPYVAIVFHGNGGGLETFYPFQQWFSSMGITSYSFDYRGYGRSSGWPSEPGIYRDADAVWQYVSARERVEPRHVIVMGQSIGSGPAAYAASKYQTRVLLLLSGYTSIYDVARKRPVLGLLARLLKPLMFYDFPVITYVSALEDTCLILAHGTQDNIIGSENSVSLKAAYRGQAGAALVLNEKAGHNDLFFKIHPELSAKVISCIKPD